MGGKAKLPPGIEKATRMKWKHAAAAAGKPAKRAAVAAPSKSRGKRKPTLAPGRRFAPTRPATLSERLRLNEQAVRAALIQFRGQRTASPCRAGRNAPPAKAQAEV